MCGSGGRLTFIPIFARLFQTTALFSPSNLLVIKHLFDDGGRLIKLGLAAG